MKQTMESCLRRTSRLSSLATETFRVAQKQSDTAITKKVEELAAHIEFLCQVTNDVVLDAYNEEVSPNLDGQVAKMVEATKEHEEMLEVLKATLEKLP